MIYIAKKPVKFDRLYSIGEIIPEAAVAANRVIALQNMGLIFCVKGLPSSESPVATDEEVANTVTDIFSGNTVNE